jgi:hypothetical protein
MSALSQLFRRFVAERAQSEIDEELRLHLDLLTEENLRQHMSWEEAQAHAQKRFGDLDQVREECVKIARRRRPVIIALKWFFGFVFVVGVVVRVFSPEYHLTRVGGILMTVGVLSRLLLYLRGMNPSRHASGHDDLASLKLNDSQLSLAAYDQRKRTPVERVIYLK